MGELIYLTSELKRSGGKLLRVCVEVDASRNVVSNVVFTGDFFMFPESAVRRLEEFLKGARASKTELTSLLEKFFDEEKISVYGLDRSDFVKVIEKALKRLEGE